MNSYEQCSSQSQLDLHDQQLVPWCCLNKNCQIAQCQHQSDTLSHPLDMLSTKYKQNQYFNIHPLAAKPETVILGHRYETQNNLTRTVYDSYQYVSIEATLRSLLVNSQYVDLLHQDKCVPGDCWGWFAL